MNGINNKLEVRGKVRSDGAGVDRENFLKGWQCNWTAGMCSGCINMDPHESAFERMLSGRCLKIIPFE